MSVRKGLRPMGVTVILDEATRLVRRRPALYYSLSLPIMLPFFIAVISYLQYVYWYAGAYQHYASGLALRSFFVGSFFMLRFLSHGAICHAVIQDLEGYEVTAWECWKKAISNCFGLFFGGLALWSLALFGSFFILVPGLYFAALLAGYPFFVLSDDRRYFSMIFHSFKATVGLMTRIMSLHCLLLLGAIMFGFGVSLSLPFLLGMLQTVFAVDVIVLEKVISFSNPVYKWGLIIFVWAVFEPVRVVAQLRLNLDGKIRRNGYDLLDRVSRLTGVDLRKAAVFFLIFALTSAANTAYAQQESITVDQFSRRVQRAQEVIDEALDEFNRTNEVNPSRVTNACQQLDGLLIRYKGQRVEIHDEGWARLTGDIDEQLPENQIARLNTIKARLNYLEEGLDTLIASEETDRESFKAEISEILEQKRFLRRKPNSNGKDLELGFLDSWLSRISNKLSAWEWPESVWWNKFKSWVKGLWKKTPSMGGNWTSTWENWRTPLLALVITIVIGLLSWFIVKKYIIPAANSQEDEDGQLTIGRSQSQAAPVVAYESTEDSWRGDARRFAGASHYDYAVRSSYAGLLLTLNGEGWIEYTKTRTNWDYQREVKKRRKELGSKMEPLTRTFDEKWYGKKDCNQEDYDNFRRDLDSVIQDLSAGEDS
jgi:hypothetical protein